MAHMSYFGICKRARCFFLEISVWGNRYGHLRQSDFKVQKRSKIAFGVSVNCLTLSLSTESKENTQVLVKGTFEEEYGYSMKNYRGELRFA